VPEWGRTRRVSAALELVNPGGKFAIVQRAAEADPADPNPAGWIRRCALVVGDHDSGGRRELGRRITARQPLRSRPPALIRHQVGMPRPRECARWRELGRGPACLAGSDAVGRVSSTPGPVSTTTPSRMQIVGQRGCLRGADGQSHVIGVRRSHRGSDEDPSCGNLIKRSAACRGYPREEPGGSAG
jgi:hypothetical protein